MGYTSREEVARLLRHGKWIFPGTGHMRDVGSDIFGGEKSMKCAFHPEVAAAGFCRSCGKAMCPACACPNPRDRRVLYCEKCLFLLIARVEEGRARIESPMN